MPLRIYCPCSCFFAGCGDGFISVRLPWQRLPDMISLLTTVMDTFRLKQQNVRHYICIGTTKYDMYIERKRIKINRICSIKKTWFGARQKRKCPWNLPILVISKLFEQGVGDALNLGEFHCKCKMEGYKIGVNKEKHTKRFKRFWGQSTKNKSWNPIRMHFASWYCNPMCCVKIVFGPFFLVLFILS